MLQGRGAGGGTGRDGTGRGPPGTPGPVVKARWARPRSGARGQRDGGRVGDMPQHRDLRVALEKAPGCGGASPRWDGGGKATESPGMCLNKQTSLCQCQKRSHECPLHATPCRALPRAERAGSAPGVCGGGRAQCDTTRTPAAGVRSSRPAAAKCKVKVCLWMQEARKGRKEPVCHCTVSRRGVIGGSRKTEL